MKLASANLLWSRVQVRKLLSSFCRFLCDHTYVILCVWDIVN